LAGIIWSILKVCSPASPAVALVGLAGIPAWRAGLSLGNGCSAARLSQVCCASAVRLPFIGALPNKTEAAGRMRQSTCPANLPISSQPERETKMTLAAGT